MSTTSTLSIATILLSASCGLVGADVVVPAGFEVQLTPLVASPAARIEAVRHSKYGDGVIAAWIEQGTLVVRQLDDGQVTDCTLGGFSGSQSVWDVRFDTTSLFDNQLFVSIGNSGPATASEFYAVGTDCGITSVASLGGAANELVFSFDFTTSDHGYLAGAYLEDIDGAGPPFPSTALWHATWTPGTFNLVELAPNLLPPGRSDIDAWIEFDRTATNVFAGHLLMCDCDTADDGLSAIYRLRPDSTFQLYTDEASTNERCLMDIAISTGGAFGEVVYVADSRVDEIQTGSALTTFASGFTEIRSITIGESGDTLYVLDSTGVYRIRPACVFDLDDSGAVDLADLLMVLAAWGPCPGCPEDFDSNGSVDLTDLLAVLGSWGDCP